MSSGALIGWLRKSRTDPVVALSNRELPVALRRHPTAKRMTLRLEPDGSAARLTVPRWTRTEDALEFARSRASWLEDQLARAPKPITVGPGTQIRFRGAQITVNWAPARRRAPALAGDVLRLGGPKERVPARVQRWLEDQAQSLMLDDLEEYCAKADCDLPQLHLSRARRRWGSCSSTGAVRINWRLVQAPDLVRRSVVAHEVAHLVHFDHSPQFHALLRRIFGSDLDAADRWLKDHGRALYAAFP